MTTKEGGLRGSIRNVGVGVVDIPDSVVHQYVVENFTASNWPDSEGDSDIDTISGLSFDENAFGGDGGVAGDGTDDFGQSDTMGTFFSDFLSGTGAVAFGFAARSNGEYISIRNSGDDVRMRLADGARVGASTAADETFAFEFRDGNNNTWRGATERTVRDDTDRVVIVNKTGNTSGTDDLEIWFGKNDEATLNFDPAGGSFDSPADFDVDMTYFAENNGGSVGNECDMDMSHVMWFDDSLNSSERQQVFDFYEWF